MRTLLVLMQASPQTNTGSATSTITTITAIVGAVFGVAGFALAWLNYRRDNPKVLLWFKGGMLGLDGTPGEWVTLWVCNSGRRSLHIVNMGFRLPIFPWFHHVIAGKRKRITHLLWTGKHLAPISVPWRHPVDHAVVGGSSVQMWDLPDGGKPIQITIKQCDFVKYKTVWKRIQAFACDSSGIMHVGGHARGEQPTWK